MNNRDALRLRITEAVNAYCDAEHDFGYSALNPVVRLHEPTFSADEINAALDCLLSTHVTMGQKVKSFETAFSSSGSFGPGVMVNSGSSANLLAIAALTNPEARDGLQPGDEVIVPALSWSTTVWPLVQLGLIPVVVDIDPTTLNVDPNEIEAAITEKTRGIMVVHVYGNPCELDAIQDICNRHSLILIEDCCEALGANYDGKSVGNFGRVGTFSFYFSHHITTLEGGITIAQEQEDAELMRILRAHGWIREVEDQTPWTERYPEIHPRFLFVNLGYNLRATELQGAIGLVQLPKLPKYVKTRRLNAERFTQRLLAHAPLLHTQSEIENGKHSWFGFPIILSKDAPFSANEIMATLGGAGIETRPIICGNIARQPGLKLYPHRAHGDLSHASAVMDRGFSFGNHQDIDVEAQDHILGVIEEFLSDKGALSA
ncbi:MAG: DegT/DnrJ/EryC1/StrS family aminotransferase [Candidatus Latescibacterota bacterium]